MNGTSLFLIINIILIYISTNPNDFRIFSAQNNVKGNVFYFPSYNLSTLDNLNTPYLLEIDKSKNIDNTFIPFKSNDRRTINFYKHL